MTVDAYIEDTLDERRSRVNNQRFETPLYTVTQAARLVGMSPSTLATWAKGYERQRPGKADVSQGPVITAIEADAGMPSIPFIGLVESTVVEAFRRSGLPMQRIRKALEVLAAQGELEHALASKQLYTDGAEILYDYAGRSGDKQMRLLTVVSSKQIVFHDVIEAYLERISFGDTWATELIVPVTEHPILRIRPNVAGGDPLFMEGGAPLSAVHDRFAAGESIRSIARDYAVPEAQIDEALHAVWPRQAAA